MEPGYIYSVAISKSTKMLSANEDEVKLYVLPETVYINFCFFLIVDIYMLTYQNIDFKLISTLNTKEYQRISTLNTKEKR